MQRPLILAVALLGLLGSLIPTAAFAAAETNVTSGLTLQGSGLAAHGHDVVAYFTEGQPTIGRAEFSTAYRNATYRFATEEHRQAFQKDPERYVPQYGGYCAYGVSVGAKFDGDPRIWRIVDGRLYLNLNEDIQSTWEKDIPGNIKKADQSWSKIAHKTPDELK